MKRRLLPWGLAVLAVALMFLAGCGRQETFRRNDALQYGVYRYSLDAWDARRPAVPMLSAMAETGLDGVRRQSGETDCAWCLVSDYDRWQTLLRCRGTDAYGNRTQTLAGDVLEQTDPGLTPDESFFTEQDLLIVDLLLVHPGALIRPDALQTESGIARVALRYDVVPADVADCVGYWLILAVPKGCSGAELQTRQVDLWLPHETPAAFLLRKNKALLISAASLAVVLALAWYVIFGKRLRGKSSA